MTTEEITTLVNTTNIVRSYSRHLRKGQTLMNVLFESHREVYNQITGTDDDPFYNDAKIDSFLTKIQELN